MEIQDKCRSNCIVRVERESVQIVRLRSWLGMPGTDREVEVVVRG